MWSGKVLDNISFEDNFRKLNELIKKFDKLSSNLPKTDINQYSSIQELSDALEKYENRQRRNVKKVEGGNVVFNNNRYFIVNPLTLENSCYYGKGTKWCTASQQTNHFNSYNDDGKLFYIIDKALPTDDPNYKIAMLWKFDGEMSFWDARDDKKSPEWFAVHNPQSKEIFPIIKSYMESEFKEQLEAYREKERKRNEREKLERLRIRRQEQLRRDEAEERRMDNEWDLNDPNIDEEGLKAHALLEHLSNDGDFNILSNEDREQINSLKSEIERLQAEYDQSEDTRTDLLDSISELEDELSEYDDYIDVYSIIPDGEYYEMTQFVVLGSSNEYAVGDAREMEDSAEEYVGQLLDDVGYEGFNKNFVRNYVDEESILSTIRNIYDDDVRSNPESYLDDSQRQLSTKQEEQITRNKMKMQKISATLEALEESLDETEDEDEIEKIQDRIDWFKETYDELEEEIEEIESEPDGDFSEEDIEERVEDMMTDAERNIDYYVSEFGLNVEDYIDREAFIEGVIQEDGYGTINGYDGSVEEYYVKDILFYVMRIN